MVPAGAGQMLHLHPNPAIHPVFSQEETRCIPNLKIYIYNLVGLLFKFAHFLFNISLGMDPYQDFLPMIIINDPVKYNEI